MSSRPVAAGSADERARQVGRLFASSGPVLGAAPGVPLDVVYEVNARRIWADRVQGVAGLETGLPSPASRRRLDALEELVAATPAECGRQFLDYDSEGHGAVTEVLGDVESAAVNVVLVNGRGPGIVSAAHHAERAAAILAESGPGCAVVSHEARVPAALLASAKPTLARRAGPQLKDLVAGLREHARPDAEFAAVLYSYGVSVGAYAALAGARFSRVLLVGDPGVPGLGENGSVQELFGRKHVYAARNPGDPVPVLHPHGRDPVKHGATLFETGGPSWAGHKDYFTSGSAFMRNLGHFVRGELDLITSPSTSRADQLDALAQEAVRRGRTEIEARLHWGAGGAAQLQR